MSKKELEEFLDQKPGYVKKGSGTLIELLKAKGISLVGLTQEDVKDVLKNRVAIMKSIKKGKTKLKILTYDIETSFVMARVWGTGKQYVGHDSIQDETQIITVAYKWLGSDIVHHLEWSRKKRSDKKLMKKFLKEYNKADLVVGWNNNSFDNKIVNSRAMKYGYDVNTHVKSFDIMRQVKKVFRLPSYSMAYVSKYLGLGGKLQHNGIKMWEDIIFRGSKKDYRHSMDMMIKYNLQDVALTEEIYIKLRKYLGHVIHIGVMQGKGKATCPNCGSKHAKLYKTIITPAGTIQRVMKCDNDKVKFKINNSNYLQR